MSKNLIRLVGTGDNPEERPGNDFYQTPAPVTRAILDREPLNDIVMEPACGLGAISNVLHEYGYNVRSSDLHNYGYGTQKDFLSPIMLAEDVGTVITNPPFKYAEDFLLTGLTITMGQRGKVILLLKLSFLEGQKRKAVFETTPLKKVWVFSKRVSFNREDTLSKQSGMMAFAWFVWDWTYDGEPTIGWI